MPVTAPVERRRRRFAALLQPRPQARKRATHRGTETYQDLDNSPGANRVPVSACYCVRQPMLHPRDHPLNGSERMRFEPTTTGTLVAKGWLGCSLDSGIHPKAGIETFGSLLRTTTS